MLGAQALRTKQRVEEKERQRRKREKEQKLERERQSIQIAANEDQAAMLEFMAQQQSTAFHQNNVQLKPHQRHSLHTTVINDIPLSGRDVHLGNNNRLSTRSPSTDYTKGSETSSGGNRLFRWLGLTSNNQKKNDPKRRMSTF